MLGYNEIPPDAYTAGENSPGTAWIEPDIMAAEIKQAKLKADIVIVALHMGTEYTVHPTEHQRDVARRAVAAGADLIIGDHPHVVQATEFIGRTFVTYSLGDFVYVQPGSPATGEALILRAVIDGQTVKQVDLLPVYIDRAQPCAHFRRRGQADDGAHLRRGARDLIVAARAGAACCPRPCPWRCRSQPRRCPATSPPFLSTAPTLTSSCGVRRLPSSLDASPIPPHQRRHAQRRPGLVARRPLHRL